jgi:hypothetical protein
MRRGKEDRMSTRAGLWIDHRKAVVVTVTDGGNETRLVLSAVEKHLERSGDSPLKGAFEARQVPTDDHRQKALTGHLNVFYAAVIAGIGDAESILIFGPGEAKDELVKRLGRGGLGERVAGVETVDKMTDRQIAAKVRACAAGPHPQRRAPARSGTIRP